MSDIQLCSGWGVFWYSRSAADQKFPTINRHQELGEAGGAKMQQNFCRIASDHIFNESRSRKLSSISSKMKIIIHFSFTFWGDNFAEIDRFWFWCQICSTVKMLLLRLDSFIESFNWITINVSFLSFRVKETNLVPERKERGRRGDVFILSKTNYIFILSKTNYIFILSKKKLSLSRSCRTTPWTLKTTKQIFYRWIRYARHLPWRQGQSLPNQGKNPMDFICLEFCEVSAPSIALRLNDPAMSRAIDYFRYSLGYECLPQICRLVQQLYTTLCCEGFTMVQVLIEWECVKCTQCMKWIQPWIQRSKWIQ